MLIVLLRSIKKYGWLRWLLFVLIASSTGAGLTYIFVFSELLRLHVSSTSFAIAFVLSIVPGFLGSIIGKYLLFRIDAKFCFVFSEFIGGIGLVIPWYGASYHSIICLQFSEVAVSVAGGILLPSLNHYTKILLEKEDIGAGAVIDTVVFTCEILFGIAVGIFLVRTISVNQYLILNACVYVISFCLALDLPRVSSYRVEPVLAQPLLETLSTQQRFSLYSLPVLAFTTVPGIVLLPTIVNISSNMETAVLLLLFARSVGQLIGPFFLAEKRDHLRSPIFVIIYLFLFIICYVLATLLTQLVIVLLCIFLAHVFSNLIFSFSWYSILVSFNEKQIASASANTYRKHLFVIAFMGTGAGVLADYTSPRFSFYFLSLIGFLCSTFLVFYFERIFKNHAET